MLLVWTIFLPLLGAIVLGIASALSQSAQDRALRNNALKAAALGITLLTFALSLGFLGGAPRELHYRWIGTLGASLHLRLDGVSLWLFLLTAFLMPICVLASWRSILTPRDPHSASDWGEAHEEERGVGGFLVCLLLTEAAILGTFAAFDLLLFFFFWEMMLIPMYFLIGIWGSPGVRDSFFFGRVPERIYATIKFVLYTMAGSALMLVGIIWLRLETGSFDVEVITQYVQAGGLARTAQFWLFWAFFVAFAIKVPVFPFHTWLPDAHTQAPTAGSMILAGVLLKLGTYGILRFCLPWFPEAVATYAGLVSVLAVVGILYGALVAMVQPDMKRLVAYSSISHLGFVLLGLFAGNNIGVQGAVLQMVNHGLSTGALFMLVGMLYERRHTRLIADFGGIARSMPIYAAFFLIITLSSIGLPATNGFVGEFLILLGTFLTEGRTVYAVLGTLGVIFAAVYMLWMVQRVFFGPIRHEENRSVADLSVREVLAILPIVVMVFWIGLFPKPFLDRMDAEGWITELQKAGRPKEGAIGGIQEAPWLAERPTLFRQGEQKE
ncbi:MAG: NADH:ubiquinone oxidoreductase subunit M [Candidatus Poribacteria bacterium]|nr:MAG: NADH:ubiquinone oxidoreductase subunit M [Candidatus Poribacteria bacterium]